MLNFEYIFIFLILVASAVLLSDFLKNKKNKIKNEILRKIPHILIGLIFVFSPYFLTQLEIIFSAGILILGILIAKYSPFFNSVFNPQRKSIGLWLTPLSLIIMAWLWLPENQLIFTFGILIFTLADAMAAILGKYFAKNYFPIFNKSWIGSGGFFLTTLIILFFLAPEIKILEFILISLFLTMAEFFLIYGLDNLFLPIIASFLFFLLL